MQIRKQEVPDYDVEHSEIMLYHVRLLEELGELSEALNLLDVNAKARAIVDRTAVMEYRGLWSFSLE
jgi:peptide alpha-N-acetyltransferase